MLPSRSDEENVKLCAKGRIDKKPGIAFRKQIKEGDTMPNIDWNAEDYQAHFGFVPSYGEAVMELITAKPGAYVVDLGCGNGTLSEKLARRGYEVLGVDDSEEMLELAKKEHPSISFQKGNAVSFSLERKAEVIFSNAVLHWIDKEKQQQLLDNLYRQIVPGGELVCEFGGYGCAERVHSRLEQCFEKRGLAYPRVFYFPTIGMYAPMLEQAGFRVEYARLFDRPTVQEGENGLENWIRMFVKAPFAKLDQKTGDAIIAEAVNGLKDTLYKDGRWIVDYVRIQFRAVRTGES